MAQQRMLDERRQSIGLSFASGHKLDVAAWPRAAVDRHRTSENLPAGVAHCEARLGERHFAARLLEWRKYGAQSELVARELIVPGHLALREIGQGKIQLELQAAFP